MFAFYSPLIIISPDPAIVKRVRLKGKRSRNSRLISCNVGGGLGASHHSVRRRPDEKQRRLSCAPAFNFTSDAARNAQKGRGWGCIRYNEFSQGMARACVACKLGRKIEVEGKHDPR
jgi:hypothetical protein